MKFTHYFLAASAALFATAAFAQNAAFNPTPRGNSARWLDVQDAPPELLKKLKKKQLKIRFTLSVGSDGQTTGCTHSGKTKIEKQFGELTFSQVQRRARFSPAKNAQGSPVNGTYSSIATWGIASKTGLW